MTDYSLATERLKIADTLIGGDNPDYGGYVTFSEDGEAIVHHSYYWLREQTVWWKKNWEMIDQRWRSEE